MLMLCRQRVLGEDSLEVATTWLNLGSVLRAAGKLEEAEGACRQCLDIREHQLGPQHSDTAAAQIGRVCFTAAAQTNASCRDGHTHVAC